MKTKEVKPDNTIDLSKEKPLVREYKLFDSGEVAHRRVIKIEEFKKKDDFDAFHTAETSLKEKGSSIGTMQRDSPIGFILSDEYEMSKWRNFFSETFDMLDGIIVPGEGEHGMRGAVRIFYFEKL